MKWLRQLINPIKKTSVVKTEMFIFDEDTETKAYSDFMTKIEQNPNFELIDNAENWDQTGILTRIVTYRVRE